MRVLVVKTTSLGDIIHALPALNDAKKIYPEITFDWMVEEPFQEVPLWHPSVQRVIPVALRRWRKQAWSIQKCREILKFIKILRQERYDYIIDAQGLLKSAVLALLSRGAKRVGLSWKSAREHAASLFYHKRVVVPWGQHAVTRIRALFAQGLGYPIPKVEADYGIDTTQLAFLSLQLQKPYYVFLHGTTWATKHWPEPYWVQLAKIVSGAGYSIQLLWGNEAERMRANRIAKDIKEAFVVPHKLSLSELMGVLAKAEGIVGLDTGLSHLAAALGVPAVSLYGPSDPKQSGTLGKNQTNLAARFSCAPCLNRVCTYKGSKPVDPPCFTSLPPDLVWEHLKNQVKEAIR